MDIREKTLFSLIGAFIIILIVLILFSSTILFRSYEKIESDHVSEDTVLIVNNVNNEISNLNSIVTDWGSWDDTYSFVKGQKSDFIKLNLGTATYSSLRLNFVIITNTEGKILYGAGYNSTKNEMTPVPTGLVKELADVNSPLRNTNINNKISGFLNIPEGPVIITMYPILHTDFTGPPVGMLIMGRYLDEIEIKRLALLTLPSLSITPLESSSLSLKDRDSLIKNKDVSVDVHPINDNIIEGQRVLKDIYGNDALLLQVMVPRDIYQNGKNTVLTFIWIQLAVGAFFGLIIIFLMDKEVLSRIKKISTDFENITKKGDFSAHITISGNDELTRFAETSNQMLESLDTAHKELQKSEAQLNSIIDGSPILQFVIDQNHRIIFWNKALEKYSGIMSKDAIGTNQQWRAFYDTERPCLADLLIGGLIDKIPQWYGEKFNKSKFVEGGYEATDFFPAKGIKGKWLKFTAALIKASNGEIIGAVETLEDITDKKQAEDALQESEKRYRNVVEDQTEFISRFLPDGTHVFVNEAYCRYFNKKREDIIGKKFNPQIPEQDKSIVRQHFVSLTQDHPVAEVTHRIIMPNGQVRWQRWSDRAIFDEKGNVVEYQSVGRDVTDVKQAEEALQLAYKKLHLLSSITRHDILNQVTALKVQLELSKMETTDQDRLEYIKNEETVVDIISQQIEFTRDYQDIGINAPQWFDVKKIIENAIKTIKLGPVDVSIEFDKLEIFADPLLERVFFNLIENALRHGKKLTKIIFSYKESNDNLILICKDDGGGIPYNEKENIFNRKFFKNTGFGLFLSREILSITGLSIKETGEPGKGARFEISIPHSAYRFRTIS
ncbi:MAG: CHASE4 domain-containing protein [Methanoregulaceae archaeon]|jgi:PAS domain S-box-containing protein